MNKGKLFATYAAAAAVALAAPTHPPSKGPCGCGKSYPPGFNNDTSTHQLVSGGITRYYAVNIPNDYDDDLTKRWPLIVDYHGHGDTPWDQYDNSLYYKYEAGQEYLVVYPKGVNASWQGPTYADPNVDDLQFTTDLLAHLRTVYCIDDNLVYASGKSNGAGFVDTLACSDNGDEFAAFAMASAALYTDLSEGSCPKKRAILESHGDKDSTIPYHPTKEGSGGPLPDITQWVSWWGERTCGAGATPDYSGDLGGYNTTTYSCGKYDKVVNHYQVFDLGHCWPSSTGDNFDAQQANQAERKCLDKVLDYTPVVLQFFAQWQLDNAPSNWH